MANRPNNVTIRKDLTDYAFGIMQDAAKMRDFANSISPVVPTGAMSGKYQKFSSTASFVKFAATMARRGIGQQANMIGFYGDTGDYNLEPFGLRVSIDNTERDRAGGATNLLEQGKVRLLTINCLTSYAAEVVRLIKASVSAQSGKGVWNNPNTDPIVEINEQILAMYLATGLTPTNMSIDFGAWCVLCSNGLILKRMPGADVAAVTPQRVASMLVKPDMKINIVESAVLTGGGLENTSATAVGILGGSVFLHHSAGMATVYDPSFMKTFAMSANLFTEVYSYRDEPHLDIYENDWTCQPVVIASSLCRRIDVTGATG